MNGTNSKWQPVLSGVPQGSALRSLLFILYINDLDTGITSNISKFADDTKLFYRVSDNVTSSALHSDLDRLVAWAKKLQLEFNTNKCKVLHFGNNNNSRNYIMNGSVLEGSNVEQDLGVMISNDLNALII